jgi:hypothetical protein
VINGVGSFVKLFIVPGGDEGVNESVAVIDACFISSVQRGFIFGGSVGGYGRWPLL